VNLAAALVAVLGVLVILLMTGAKYWGLAGSLTVGVFLGWAIGKLAERAARSPAPFAPQSNSPFRGPTDVLAAGAVVGFRGAVAPVALLAGGALIAYLLPVLAGFPDRSVEPFREMFAGFHGVAIALLGMLCSTILTFTLTASPPATAVALHLLERSGADPTTLQNARIASDAVSESAANARGRSAASALLAALLLAFGSLEAGRQDALAWARREPLPASVHARYMRKSLVIEAQPGEERRIWLQRPEGGKNVALADASPYDLGAAWQLHPLSPGFLASAGCGGVFALWSIASLLVGLARAADRVEAGLRRNPDWTERDLAAAGANAAARGLPLQIGIPLLAQLAALALFGVAGSCGFTLGVLVVGAPLSLAMTRASQAWATFRRSVESGAHGGVGSAVHHLAVLGDRLGVSLAELVTPATIRMLHWTAMIGVVFAGAALRYGLF
jgi:K(+)-stimulated pyrophosphate-energized sodium pump